MVDVNQAVVDAHRREWAFVIASTVRITRDFDTAEECVQEAYISALKVWNQEGVPRNPGAWLTTASRRKALDILRRKETLRTKLHLLVEPEVSAMDASMDSLENEHIPDDRLRLISPVVILC